MKKQMLAISSILPLLTIAQDVSLEILASGFTRPCEIVHAGDERLFVVEQNGTIQILYTDGTILENPFLDIDGRVDSQGGEKGLLGLAFPPDYCTSQVFYVNYTHTSGGQLYTRISRFATDPDDPNRGDEDSEEVLMQFEQDFSNHNGGHIEFGPDGYLYIATGDGGSGGDPNNRAQDIMSLLGKILRIDVSTDPYGIPDDNPFAFVDFGLDEIWSYGLRNPWKFTFDSENGDMFIGDVGQSNREEVSYQAAGTEGGLNFGWRCFEGNANFNTSGCDLGIEYADPIFDYAYGNQGNGFRCAITGGQVYRGPSFSALSGKYLFCDYCSPEYWLLWQEGGEWQTFTGTGFEGGIVSFGTDVFGEMFAVKGSPGVVYRVSEVSDELQDQIIFSDGAEGPTLSSPLEGTSYAWFLDGAPIPGQNGNSISATSSGGYSLEITTESGCVIRTTTRNVVLSTTGDADIVRAFSLFPIPAKDAVSLNIDLANVYIDRLELVVFTADGRLVKRERLSQINGQSELNISDLNSGLYLLQLVDGQGVLATRKLIKEN